MFEKSFSNKFGAVILDEVHERTLFMDIILILTRKILAR